MGSDTHDTLIQIIPEVESRLYLTHDVNTLMKKRGSHLGREA